MPGWPDIALIVLFAAVWPLLEFFVLWPRHVRAVEAGDPRARTRVYTHTLWQEWLLAAAVVAVMRHAGRPLSALWLQPPHGWRLWLSVALPLAYGALILMQGRALTARPEALAKLRKRLQPLRALVPHTPGEYHRFVPLCFTAGFCEELLFRGYLVWVLEAWIGLWAAAGVSVVLFGLAHAYQGWRFGARAFFAGAAMEVLALLTGSLLAGMALHALIDLGSGWITYAAMREPAAERPGTVGPWRRRFHSTTLAVARRAPWPLSAHLTRGPILSRICVPIERRSDMRRSIIGLAVLTLLATSAYVVVAGGNRCSKPCGPTATAASESACGPSGAAASCENPRGKIAGHFDPVMSGACRFACATKLEYQAKEVQAQPGAKAGRLTQCPVSGVVFAVDANRPRVRIAGENYVTCCDKCAAKLKKDPRHYLKA